MIRLRVLGAIELHDAGGRELRAILAQPKRLALLVYLAVGAHRFHRRDTLLGVFWPELDDQRGRDALNQAIRFLRKELGGPTSSVIASRGDEIGVLDSALWCDVAAFRDARAAGRHSDALDLYRGDLLEGFFCGRDAEFEDWAESERGNLRAQSAQSARCLADASERSERFTTAVASARRAVELSRADERVVRELLELLDRLGDRAGAIHAYDEFARRLRAEYGAEPAAETATLIARIRSSHATATRLALPPQRTASPVQPANRKHATLVGTQLHGWIIEREIGRGAAATVYLARDEKHQRHVALKAMQAELALSISVERFLREIQIMARLAHPHILPLIDSGASDGVLYLVTPYIAGESLRARLSRDGRLPVAEALAVARDVAAALDYAHRQGVIHRDVKPENVLLQDGHALVADFGIARAFGLVGGFATSGALVPGTPSYMSPEHAAGEIIDARSDVYSLAAMLYEMLTGDPPHVATDVVSLMKKLQAEPIRSVRSRRPDVSPRVGQAVEQALAKSPDARFPSMAAFARALGDGASGDVDGRTAGHLTEADSQMRTGRFTAAWRALFSPRP